MLAYPEDSYLIQVGRLAYAVSSLEWSVLGDLTHHASALPAALAIGTLAGQTTGKIAEKIKQHLNAVQDNAVREWLKTSADALTEASIIRNHFLHARPATIDDQQRLYRWRLTPNDAFPITDQWLADQIDRIETLSAAVSTLRVK